jgi:hypothetical protein
MVLASAQKWLDRAVLQVIPAFDDVGQWAENHMILPRLGSGIGLLPKRSASVAERSNDGWGPSGHWFESSLPD